MDSMMRQQRQPVLHTSSTYMRARMHARTHTALSVCTSRAALDLDLDLVADDARVAPSAHRTSPQTRAAWSP